MQKLISGGIAFIQLDEGELYPPMTAELIEARLIYHDQERWWIKLARNGRWQNYSDKSFPSQNEAFNFAYDEFSKRK